MKGKYLLMSGRTLLAGCSEVIVVLALVQDIVDLNTFNTKFSYEMSFMCIKNYF